MQNTELKQTTRLEDTLCCIANKIMNTPYNWSLALMTIVIWAFGGAIIPYSANSNFDMAIAINEYAKLIGLAAIVLGVLKQSSYSKAYGRTWGQLLLAFTCICFNVKNVICHRISRCTGIKAFEYILLPTST
jgi:hypothetical protein